jgi:hypothetical protein
LVQCLVIILFVIVPGAWVVVRGAPALQAASTLLGALSFGTLLVMYRAVFLVFLFGVLPGPARSLMHELLAMPVVQWIILLLSVYQLVRWLGLPAVVSGQHLRAVRVLADADHQGRAVSPAEADKTDPTEQTSQERLDLLEHQALSGPLGEQFAIALHGVTPGGIAPEALGVGLGFTVGHSWRLRAKAAALGIACLALAQFWRSGQYEYSVYMLITALTASIILGGMLSLTSAWSRTAVEQGLLRLTPRWPSTKVVKLSLSTLVFRGQMGGWIGWAPIALVSGAFGWVEPQDIVFGMFILFAAMCAALAIMWASFALPSLRELNWSTLLILLSAAVGVACYWAGGPVLGFAFVLVPTVLALLAFLLRPLQFPVNLRRPAQ